MGSYLQVLRCGRLGSQLGPKHIVVMGLVVDRQRGHAFLQETKKPAEASFEIAKIYRHFCNAFRCLSAIQSLFSTA